MRLSFIGAGKVGSVIAKYLSKYEDVCYFYSRNKNSATKAANFVSCQTADLEDLIKDSDVVFITTGDNQIAQVAEDISNYDVKGKTFIHMSGALTSDELSVLKDGGALTCSMHPLQTFSDIDKAVVDIKDAYFALEGDLEVSESILKKTKNPYFVLDKSQKNKYHLSACIFSNYLVTLMNFGKRMLEDVGITEEDGLRAMKPLIDATLSNIHLKGTNQALTGPIQRADTKTLENHMKALDGVDLEAYQLLGKMTTDKLIMDDDKKSILDALWRRQ